MDGFRIEVYTVNIVSKRNYLDVCKVNLLESGQYGDEDSKREDFSSSYGHEG